MSGYMPIYKQVYSELKQMVKDGIYPAGSYLPTESQLEQQFDISRTTVRKAVKLLAEEGLVVVKQGCGTEVQDISFSQRLNKVTSFSETLREKGYEVTTQGMSIEIIPAPAQIASLLNIDEGSPVYYLQRVQCANNQPIGIMENYLIASLFPELEQHANTFVSLYNFLEEFYGLTISSANEKISAASATFIESQILQIPVGSPLLVSRRVTYSNDSPFEFCCVKSIADKYEYAVFLEERN